MGGGSVSRRGRGVEVVVEVVSEMVVVFHHLVSYDLGEKSGSS